VGSQKFGFLAVYRPSNPENNARGQFDLFFQSLENALEKLLSVIKKKRVAKIIVAVDFNINMRRNSSDSLSVRLRRTFEKFELFLMNENILTRIAKQSNDN
jgi:RNase H-fold protein (predicted Holliday junction resolvase)